MTELEYQVTFPRRLTGNRGEAGVERLREGEHKTPVIFLLGWYGCQQKYLAKYSAIHESEGFITIRYILPKEYMFGYKFGHVKDIAYQVLDTFFGLGLESHPIFFHVFSNGGIFVYRHITDILKGPSPGKYGFLQIAGVIMDSAPARPSSSKVFKTMYVVLRQSHHWVVAYVISCFEWIAFMLEVILQRLALKTTSRLTYYDDLLCDKIECPQLFLFSKADETVPYQDVQAVIEARRLAGFDVRDRMWEDSGHVLHFRYHPEEYVAICRGFLSYCLKKHNNHLCAKY